MDSIKKVVLCVLVFWGARAAAEDEQRVPGESTYSLSRGYRKFRWGDSLERTKELLKRDPYFDYRGDPDLSLLDEPNTSLVEMRGVGFIVRAYFQFVEDRLYVITLELDKKKLDFRSIFMALERQYGAPSSVTPRKSLWETDVKEISLEDSLILKYVDTGQLHALLEETEREKDFRSVLKEQFLEGL